jgi:hypothetical protein
MKRAVWFVSGAVAGIAGASYAKRKVSEAASNLAPTNVAKNAAAKVRQRGHDMVDAMREGRDAKQRREEELWARLEPVEPGEVIILREVRESDQIGPRRTSRRMRRSQ